MEYGIRNTEYGIRKARITEIKQTIFPFMLGYQNEAQMFFSPRTSNSSSKTRGAAAPHTRITWASLLGSEEPSLKLLRSGKVQRTNSSPISNCRRSKSAIFISRNINCNINSLLLLHVGTHIIYIYI